MKQEQIIFYSESEQSIIDIMFPDMEPDEISEIIEDLTT